MRLSARSVVLVLLSVFAGPAWAANNPVPQIDSSLVPSAATPGGAGFTLNVYGAGFVSTSTVNWNGSARPTTFISAAHVTVAIPASDIATKGTAFVTVSNPTPGGGSSNVAFFSVTNPVSNLTLSAYSPVALNALTQAASFYSLAVGDFNGDGKLDLALALGGTGAGVVIALGNGDGTFRTPLVTHPAGLDPQSIVACDLNGDGNLDLIIGNSDGTLTILLGNGDGTFQQKASVSAGGFEFVAGDFNGDGKLDLAVGGVSVLLGNGDGTFQSPVSYAVAQGPFAAVDLNGDGILDIITIGGSGASGFVGTPVILLGNGDGTFRTAPHATGISGALWSVSDLNGDGRPDAASWSQVFPSNCLEELQLGNGDGTFQMPSAVISDGTRACPLDVVGDLNGDGKLDLAGRSIQPGISFAQGNGDGTFQTLVNVPTNTNTSTTLFPTVIADLNRNGQMDIVARDNNNGLWILLQGVFPADTPSPATVSFGAQSGGIPSAPQTVTLTNTGSAALTISGISISGPDAGTFSETNTCGSSLAPAANCQVQVIFTPSAGGARSAFLDVHDNGVGGPLAVSLSGTSPDAHLSPSSMSFASKAIGTTSPPQTITVTNVGTATLSITGISITGTNLADFAETNSCSSALMVGAACQINVTFTPTAAGSRQASVSIVDAADGTQSVPLTGSTIAASLSPASLTFSSQFVGTSGLPQTVTLTNNGTAPFNITSVKISTADFGVLNACSNSLAVGASCSIGVFFDPTAGGTRTGTLTVTDDAGDSPQTVSLTGTGQDFSMGASGAASATITAGQTASYTISIAPTAGFNQSVALTCSGAPAMSTCTVSPSMVSLNGTAAATAMVTVTTAHAWVLPFGTGGPARVNQPKPLVIVPLGALALLVVSLLLWRREQRFRWATLFALVLVVCLGLNLSSCGGSSRNGGSAGAQAGTYTLTVSATFTSGSTTLTHATKLTLVIQ